MKTGYSQAAWRLFQLDFRAWKARPANPTWADTELAGTPFRPGTVSLPIVRPRSSQ